MRLSLPSGFMRLSSLTATLLAAFVIWCACSRTSTTSKPIVSVSIEPQRYMLEQIVGDTYNVRCLLAENANPESYDPSMTSLINTERSVAYLRMGNIGFEEAIVDKVHQSNPSLPIYDTSEGIVPVSDTHGHGSTDPHTWVSVKNAKIIAANMLRAMSEVDPDNAPRFEQNYRTFAARLDSLDSAIAAQLQPLRGAAFAVWHPSLSYFARDYGLRQMTVGGPEHREPSLPDLTARIDATRQAGALLWFVQKETDSRHADAVESELPLKRVEINTLSHDWASQMSHIASELAKAATSAP